MKIIGHRGARGLAPENTLASLQQALDHQVDQIEIDIRITKDNVPVLCHDRSLLRLSGRPLLIAGHTYEELLTEQPNLCTLEAAIALIDRRIPLVIEVKPREYTEPVVSVINRLKAKGWQDGDFLFASFSQRSLLQLHRALPGIRTVINARWLSIWARHRANQLGTKRLTMNHHFMWFGFVRATSRRYELISYTMNNPNKVRRWQQYGLAGCVTDYPDRFRNL